jgi:methionyl-tRNA formyltransferase
MTGLRLVFMGTPEFAVPSLRMLIERGEMVVAAVTQPDRPKGRGQQLASPPVKIVARDHGITVFQPARVRTPEFVEIIRGLRPDLILVTAFGQILPKELLHIPRYGCINVHALLLPRYRGAAPINWCIINGETETGITTMQMDEGLDTGEMLLKKVIPIAQDDDAQTLHDQLSVVGAEALAETLDLLITGRLNAEKQDGLLSSYAPMLKKEDGRIDWNREAPDIRNLVRGLTPWPGAFTFLGEKTVKIYRSRVAGGAGTPGCVLQADRSGLVIACGEGGLLVEELQLEGKKRLSARDFLAGYNILPGTILGNRDISHD